MTRYYVSWITDCSYGAMHVHALFEAPDIQTAKREWKDRVRDQNHYVIAVAYDKRPDYEELWRLPEFLQDKTKEEVLDYYAPPEVCSFRRKEGTCGASTRDNPLGCGRSAPPFGCAQTMRDEWEARWKLYIPAPAQTAPKTAGLIKRLWAWVSTG